MGSACVFSDERNQKDIIFSPVCCANIRMSSARQLIAEYLTLLNENTFCKKPVMSACKYTSEELGLGSGLRKEREQEGGREGETVIDLCQQLAYL